MELNRGLEEQKRHRKRGTPIEFSVGFFAEKPFGILEKNRRIGD